MVLMILRLKIHFTNKAYLYIPIGNDHLFISVSWNKNKVLVSGGCRVSFTASHCFSFTFQNNVSQPRRLCCNIHNKAYFIKFLSLSYSVGPLSFINTVDSFKFEAVNYHQKSFSFSLLITGFFSNANILPEDTGKGH